MYDALLFRSIRGVPPRTRIRQCFHHDGLVAIIVGVSTINVLSWMYLAGARIEIDGSAYAGGADEIILIDSPNMVDEADPDNITVTGFSLETAVIQDRDNCDCIRLAIGE